jgi:outer membrane protein assembly factor BamB
MKSLKCCTAALLVCASIAGAAESGASRELVSPELLAKGGVQTVWQETVPLKVDEKLIAVSVLGDGIYALTKTNYLFGLKATDGSMQFADTIAAKGLQLLPLDRKGDAILVISGSSMRRLDAKTGREKSKLAVPFGVVAVPAANDNYFYLAADDGKLYAYDSADSVMAFKGAADRGSLMTNVVASNKFVVFTTDKGAIAAITPDGPVQTWRYNASGAIRGRVTLDGDDLYVSSMDTNVYRFDAASGRMVWNSMAGAQLDQGPRVTAGVVYQFAGDNGVYALDKKDGKVLWQEKDGRDLLAEQGGKAYLISKGQSLIVVDNATGKRISEVSLPGVDIWTTNVTDEMMYVGSATAGKLACLKPAM